MHDLALSPTLPPPAAAPSGPPPVDVWTAERVRDRVSHRLGRGSLLVVSNRALVLSQFTGAAREFPEAFLVNPYNLDGTAERLGAALTMPEPQRRGRMTRLRERVLEWNIYRWAGEMLGTVLRLPDPEVIS